MHVLSPATLPVCIWIAESLGSGARLHSFLWGGGQKHSHFSFVQQTQPRALGHAENDHTLTAAGVFWGAGQPQTCSRCTMQTLVYAHLWIMLHAVAPQSPPKKKIRGRGSCSVVGSGIIREGGYIMTWVPHLEGVPTCTHTASPSPRPPPRHPPRGMFWMSGSWGSVSTPGVLNKIDLCQICTTDGRVLCLTS